MKVKLFRGTHDLLPETKAKHTSVEVCARRVLSLYGFEEISTPIFEYLETFVHTLGDTSDVVTKEMFTLKDRHDDLLALRPEGTAGVMRAVLSQKLHQSVPLKYFYMGPMFRYERPQAGRTRQFHQVGAEHIGEAHPLADAEIITMAHYFLESLKLKGSIALELNTLGDVASRMKYREALVYFLTKQKDLLSQDSKIRLEKNPLRILDSKDETDQNVLANAPKLSEYLSKDSQLFFDQVRNGLDRLGISYTLNERLVRGLDYYGHTAFEFKASDLGAQSTVLGGGRYDSLSEQMGGPHLPSVGWAAGIERLVLLTEQSRGRPVQIAVVPLGDEAESYAWTLAERLRKKGFCIHLSYEGSVKARMKKANKVNANIALIMGEEELRAETITVKNLDSGLQETIPSKNLESFLKNI